MSCGTPPIPFGQSVLSGIKWPIQLKFDTLFLPGIIGTPVEGQFDANGNQIVAPLDLTGCQLDFYINDPETGNLVVNWSSGGISPAVTLFVGVIVYPNPNWQLSVSNAALNALEISGDFPARMVLTDSAGNVRTLWQGVASFNE